jgi:hypothetical protein
VKAFQLGKSGGTQTSDVSNAGYYIKNDLKISVSIIQDEIRPIPPAKELSPGASVNFDPSSRITVYYKDSAGKDLDTTIGSIKLKDAIKDQKGPTYSVSLSELSSILAPLKSSGSQGGSRRRSSGGGGQTTGDVVQLTGNPGDIKVETLANGETFTYTIKSPTEFSYVWKDKDGKEKKKNDSVTTTYSKWNQTATAINAIPVTTPAQTAPAAPTAPATEAAPAGQTTGGETAPAEGGMGQAPADNLTVNVARLFSNVEGGHTYAVKTLANERRMVRGMLEAIRGIRGGVVYDAPLSLAKIIVGYSRSALASSNLAKIDSGELSGMSEKQIEKTFPTELSIIMRGIVGLDRTLGGRSGYASIARYVRFAEAKKADTPKAPADAAAPSAPASAAPAAAATPPATPAPATGSAPATPAAATGTPAPKKEEKPVGEKADDGTTKKSSRIDPRIKKLATLRRLRVRSQMEAAVESSAQLGRFRIS